MKIYQFAIELLVCIAICYFLSCSQPQHTHPQVMLSTELGDIVVEVYLHKAPVTAANFLRYVNENRYREAHFYRVVTMDNQPNHGLFCRNDMYISDLLLKSLSYK